MNFISHMQNLSEFVGLYSINGFSVRFDWLKMHFIGSGVLDINNTENSILVKVFQIGTQILLTKGADKLIVYYQRDLRESAGLNFLSI